MDLLRYDFGYEWPWTWGHAIATLVFAGCAVGLYRARWRRAGALFAPSAFVMAETLAAESVPSAVRGVSGTAVRGAVSQGARAESASVIEATIVPG